MKKITFTIISLSFILTNSFSQSFEAANISGVTTTPSNSRSANFIDINNDGWDDIFITNSSGPGSGENNMLYLNNTDGTFTTITNDPITQDNSRSVAASFADADNDGDLDAYMVTWGSSTKNYFYRNNGNGIFSYEPTNVSGSVFTFSEMVTWIDANNDQNLDIFYTNSAGNATNSYYENQTDGTFVNNTSIEFTNEFFGTRSVDLIDYDNDGDCDLFLTNENTTKNSLYRNDGTNNYTKITNLSFVQDLKNSAGSSWADIDNDGDFDLLVTNYETNGQSNQLFRNNGSTFTEETSSPIALATSSSFGSTFGDLDNDGDLDLIVCNSYLSSVQNNYIYINDGSGNFTQDTSSALATFSGWTYSAAFGDYDNNGWLDVIYANNQNGNQTNALFRNTGTGNNWVKINCSGTNSNNSAIGAKVRIKSTINGNEVWQTRKIVSSSGYCSQNSYTQHFGLGNATIIEALEITWPIGTVETYNNLNINTTHNVIEGTGLGISEMSLHSFKLFPNPVKDTITIRLGSKLVDSKNNVFTIFNMNGKRVKTVPLNNTETYDVSELKTGNYIYTISKNNTIHYSGKLIKN
ncbi:FG-GAP-like repeat-containing protein [uncultured Lacinutrix sp.]|uniref:FG-GAP-like repeat-containing protein n=1 Tax=uncultured Lacinutrix sp. TaxID=574032 RepID=UPI0026203B5C|nr:FG-GAP-like repeat-containing protein [uncultured Lacinutrix sp.]